MGCGASRAVQRLEKKAERAERRHSDLTEAAAAAAQKALEQKEKREKQRVARQKSSIKLKDATASTHPRWSLEGTTCQAKCLRVVDGDTVEIAIGAPLYGSLRVRLLGIDTEEMHQPTDMEGAERKARIALALKARNALAHMATGLTIDEEEPARGAKFDEITEPNKRVLWCEFGEADKYGRYLVTLWEKRGDKTSINDRLVEDKLALRYDGGKKADVGAALLPQQDEEAQPEDGEGEGEGKKAASPRGVEQTRA